MLDLIKDTILYVLQTLIHDSIPLLFGIIVASILNVYIDPEKLKALLLKRKKASIIGSVAFGAFTPLCSCGTMAVIVSMLTTVLPWGPIMAFITSSPLMSPDLFVMLSGIISVKFAVALTMASIIIGLAAGNISHYLETNTGFFDNQVRFSSNKQAGNSECCSKTKTVRPKKFVASKPVKYKKSCCTNNDFKFVSDKTCCTKNDYEIASDQACCSKMGFIKKYKLNQLLGVFISLGVKQILFYFSAFAAIGYIINRFVPTSIIVSLFGAKSMFSVPLSALIGIPLYVSDAGSIPLIKTLMNSGASGGAVLAFMITGPGTSIGAITGSLTIMKKKAVFFYVGILLISAILLGYLYNFLLFAGL